MSVSGALAHRLIGERGRIRPRRPRTAGVSAGARLAITTETHLGSARAGSILSEFPNGSHARWARLAGR